MKLRLEAENGLYKHLICQGDVVLLEEMVTSMRVGAILSVYGFDWSVSPDVGRWQIEIAIDDEEE